MSAALIPAQHIPIARTDADWGLDINFPDEDWTGATVKVAFARQGLRTDGTPEPTFEIDAAAPNFEVACAIRIPAETWAAKAPGTYSVQVRKIAGAAIDDAAVFRLLLYRGVSDTDGPASPPAGDGQAVGNVIVSRQGPVSVVRGGGGVAGRSAYQQAVIDGYEGTEAEYAAAPIDAAALASENAALAAAATLALEEKTDQFGVLLESAQDAAATTAIDRQRAEMAAIASNANGRIYATTAAARADSTLANGQYFLLETGDLWLKQDATTAIDKAFRYASSGAVAAEAAARLVAVQSADLGEEVIAQYVDTETGLVHENVLAGGGRETLTQKVTYETGDSETLWEMRDAEGMVFARITKDLGLDLADLSVVIDPNGTSLLEVRDDIGFVYWRLNADGTTESAGSAPVLPVAPVDANIILGGDLYAIAGRPMPLYLRNLFPDRRDDPVVIGQLASTVPLDGLKPPYVLTGDNALEITPERLGTATVLSLRLANDLPSRRWSVPLTVHVAPAVPTAPAPIRVMLIGDSITNRQQAFILNKILTARGHAVTFVGTVNGNAPGDSDAMGTGGPLGEGREGWQFADFTHARLSPGSIGRGDPVAVGGEAAYMALPKGQRIEANPFIRVSTGSDGPDVIRNGYVFDFAFYLSRFGLTAPDVVLIGLGTNDVAKNSPALALSQVRDGVALMCKQIRAAAPACRIGLWMPIPSRDVERDELWPVAYAPALREIVKFGRQTPTDPLTRVVNVHAHQTTETGFFMTSTTPDPDTGVIVADVSDSSHPRDATRHQIAEVLAAFVANVI